MPKMTGIPAAGSDEFSFATGYHRPRWPAAKLLEVRPAVNYTEWLHDAAWPQAYLLVRMSLARLSMAEPMKISTFPLQVAICLALVITCLAIVAGPALAQQRRLAPGVVTTLPSTPEDEEMFHGPRPLVEIPIAIPGLDYKPNLNPKSDTVFERAKISTLRRTIWNLEFSFKPLRMVEVEMPQANNRMQRKLIWYMVYKVKNNGAHWKPLFKKEDFRSGITDYTYGKELTNEIKIFGRDTEELRFFPHFVLDAVEFNKQYLDRVLPAAMAPIRAREFPGDTKVKLFDSQQISEIPIGVSLPEADKSVWGVVTWEDVDPRVDYASIYIQGLTNAYHYEDPPGAFQANQPPSTGRKMTKKTLRMNFWRPGDAIDENEGEIRYGMRLDADAPEQAKIFALFGASERVDHQWLYR